MQFHKEKIKIQNIPRITNPFFVLLSNANSPQAVKYGVQWI